jgi:hypothetical protein
MGSIDLEAEPAGTKPAPQKALSSRSEGVALRPFSDLQALEDFIDSNLILEVASNVAVDPIPHGAWLGLAGDDFAQLGIKIKIEDIDKLKSLISPIVMDLADVTTVLVAMDRGPSTLRDSHILSQSSLQELSPELIINESGSNPPYSLLSNRRSGFRIELAFVQNKDISGDNPTRPRKKGALIAKAAWEVKPVADGDVFQPEELTDELRTELGLTKHAWVYLERKPGFLSATTFRDAARFYVDKKLLGQIQLLTGEPKRMAEMMIYSSAITHLIYEVSLSFNDQDFMPDAEELNESQVMRLLRLKFKEKQDTEIIEFIKGDPGRALAEFLANPKDFKNLIGALEGLNGGANELPDFEDE